MVRDIRIAVSFRGHRKRQRLKILLGVEATGYLIDLWIASAMNHPSGVLAGMDAIDVALEAGWQDDPETFVAALLKVGFLETDASGNYVLHDWPDHQGFVVHSPSRSEKARKAAAARWEGNKPCQNAPSMQQACSEHAASMLPHASSNAPSPTPIPSPSPKHKEEENSASASPDAVSDQEEFYLTKRGKKLSGKKLSTFNRFWKSFAFTRGKAEAADAWLNIPDLTDSLVEKILVAAEAEAAARPVLVASGHSPKWAQGWLSGRRWEDEPIQPTAQPASQKTNLAPDLATRNLHTVAAVLKMREERRQNAHPG